MLASDFSSSVKQWCGYELVHGYRFVSDMFNTGAEVRCYNSNDKWITNRSIFVNQLIPILLLNTGAEVRCYNSNNKWITNRSISI
jgi:hypothetical protein